MPRRLTLLCLAALVAAVFTGTGSTASHSGKGGKFVITQTVMPIFVKRLTCEPRTPIWS